MAKAYKITKEQEQEIFELIKKGYRISDISKKYGISVSGIHHYKGKLGLTRIDKKLGLPIDYRKEGSCGRCEILLKYGGIGTEEYCEDCANELGIITQPS